MPHEFESFRALCIPEPPPHIPPDEPVSQLRRVSLSSETAENSETVLEEGCRKSVEYMRAKLLGLDSAGTSAQVPTQSILAEADAIAGEDRSRDYGHPLANHRRIAEIWNVQMEKKLSANLTPSDVAVMMIGLKLARLINSPSHRDSMTDIAGYVKCWDMIQEAGGE